MGFFPYTYKTPQYGEKDFEQAKADYAKISTKYGDLISGATEDVRGGLDEAKGLRSFYRPGGDYGKSLKATTKQEIQRGVAKSSAAAVASGQSSMFASRGINVLAASEYAKRQAEIEEGRAELEMKAFQPYTQMLANLSQLASTGAAIATAAPKRSQYVTQGQPYISGAAHRSVTG